MPIMGAAGRYNRPKTKTNIAPYYGISQLLLMTADGILSLSNRGTAGTLDCTFSLNPGTVEDAGWHQWFCYPAEYGPAQFVDRDNNFIGGWDGAHDDFCNIYGPSLVNVLIEGKQVPFYCYRTDHPDLGLCNWQTSSAQGL